MRANRTFCGKHLEKRRSKRKISVARAMRSS